ncbi:hypothetical protein CANTEDRAFT_113899 [Yamadazyma tenuis ATCC 10573]|uniref:DUF1746 domain-containing protein n=3 Tax=Candida tenuis TaxID=2315449 RepID=G3B4V3_CANTC|nr:uncharacterized protein CANTEDRAFT_113899 [Yamadazyma tenuis ATCC 10573]EGV64276.1 hypothetical protein CANTEDRAFT_113899 [Yamadazyma tenuis ATCC 10573]
MKEIEHIIRDYQQERYPSPEETRKNNATILYKRKKFFLGELRHSFRFMGFLLIVIVYLRDLSTTGLVLRGFSQYTLSNPYPSLHLYTEESKKGLSKFLLLTVIVLNGFYTLIHLVFGAYSSPPHGDKHFLHGSSTIEFIGERVPFGRLELLILDVMIFFFQVVLHNLMCYVQDFEILSVTVPHDSISNPTQDIHSEWKVHNDCDGYNGDVVLLCLDIISNIKVILSYRGGFTLSPQEEERAGQPRPVAEIPYPIPGSFS